MNFKNEVSNNEDQDLKCKECKLTIDDLQDSTYDGEFKDTKDDASFKDENSRSTDIKIETPVKQNVKLFAVLAEVEDDDLGESTEDDDDEVVMYDDDITHSKDCNELKGNSADEEVLHKDDITDSKDKKKHKATNK